MLNTTYLIWMAGSVLIACGVHLLTASSLQKKGLTALLTTLFGTILAIVFARLGYCLLQPDYTMGYGLDYILLSDDMSFMSYYCGMLGVILGAILAAMCTGNKIMTALNVYAPAGALLASLTRFGEHFLDMICAGNYVEDEALCFFPFAVSNEWGEWYVAVHIFAGVFYLLIAIASLTLFKERRFLRTLFYLCLVQVLLESLRNQSLIWSQFIRVEQLLCMVVVEVILILMGVWAGGRKERFLPAIIGVLCVGVFVVVEFALDGKIFNGVSKLVFYTVMALGLIVLGAAENWLNRRLPKQA